MNLTLGSAGGAVLTGRSLAGVAGAIGRFLFDYNTVEAVLLASALLVSLAGVMFGATTASAGSTFYQQSRDGVTSAILIVITVSIIYWLAVVVVELYVVFGEQRAVFHRVNAIKGFQRLFGCLLGRLA